MQFETWFEQDLKKPIRVQYMKSTLFTMDDEANLIGVRLFDDGSPATVSGTVSATVIRPDGATVPILSGLIDGNEVSVILPQTAYAYNGQFSIVIKVSNGSEVTTVCAAVGTMFRSSTDAVVDPGTIIGDVNTLVAMLENAGGIVNVTVSGTSPSITGEANHRYLCGEVDEITITPPAEGIMDVVFTSGSTPTILELPDTVLLPDWFDDTALDADTIYEINIMDGIYGVVAMWNE